LLSELSVDGDGRNSAPVRGGGGLSSVVTVFAES
jgi:hypothetical protein